jgi:hypothetical protein
MALVPPRPHSLGSFDDSPTTKSFNGMVEERVTPVPVFESLIGAIVTGKATGEEEERRGHVPKLF